MPMVDITKVEIVGPAFADESLEACNLVIRNTFLEFLDCKALGERTSRRRARSLDVDRASFPSKEDVLPFTKSAPTGASDTDLIELVDVGSGELCSRQSSSMNLESSPCDEVASPNGGFLSLPKQLGSSKRAINLPEVELANIKARLDGATTVMVQKMRKDLTQAFFEYYVCQDLGFGGEFDFMYVPTCFHTGRSKGYGFVNFLTTEMAAAFSLSCAQRNIRVTRADLQGREAYISRFSKRKSQRVRNNTFKPIIFGPDGRRTQL
eukprot:TRINITY_DN24131_c0_g4_i1.p1 TRINITY_DN24131_c0_g4~~TRINITY_DN24131_c0_g4_i1.p1  ORF type:complete len:265 (-),score=31.67 TRINITY_DN24131_c0_g4_i1:461-1255(-)